MKHIQLFIAFIIFPASMYSMQHALKIAGKYTLAACDKTTGALGWGLVAAPCFINESEVFLNRDRSVQRIQSSTPLDAMSKRSLLGAAGDGVDVRMHNGPISIVKFKRWGDNKDECTWSIYSCYEGPQKTIYIDSELIDAWRAAPVFKPCLKGALEHELVLLEKDHTTLIRLAAAATVLPYYGAKKVGNMLFGKANTMRPALRIGRLIGRLSIAVLIMGEAGKQLYAFKRFLVHQADAGISQENIAATIDILRRDPKRIAHPLDIFPLPKERIAFLKERQGAQ